MKKIIIGISLALLIGCAAAIDSVSEKSATDQPVSSRKLFDDKCRSCHKPKDLSKYDDGKLRLIVSDHRKRAHLSTDEIARLSDYLVEQKGASTRLKSQ